MQYEVTIGIPVYQVEDYIRRTMESALAQIYPNIEFLVINDGSDDKSADTIRELQRIHPRGKDIRFIQHKHNLGVATTRNEIIKEARGNYLYFMDSDDVINENTISLLMKHINEFEADIAFGSYEKIGINGERIIYQYPKLFFDVTEKLSDFAYRRYAGIQASACNFIVRRSVLQDNKLYFCNSRFWEDTIFTLELVTYIQRAVFLPDITYSYLCRKHSLSDIPDTSTIKKRDIIDYFQTVNQLKLRKEELMQYSYFPDRCYVAVMSDFYIICNILKRWQHIYPTFTYQELKYYLKHPASLAEICSFKNKRLQNLILYLLGKLPATMCITLIRYAGKRKGLI